MHPLGYLPVSLSLRAVALQIHPHLLHIMCVGLRCDEIGYCGCMETPPETTPLHCVECGMRLFYAGVGRKPRYCSQTCRSRAWEKRRAARDGLIAQEVVERPVEVYKPIDAEQVAQWLSGHPRRLSAVLKMMEWTDEHLEAFRNGLEHSAEELSLIPIAEKERLESALQETFRLKNDLAYQQHRLREQKKENAALRRELERSNSREQPNGRKRSNSAEASAAVAEQRPAAKVAPLPTFSGETKTIIVSGQRVTVPVQWSRKRARQWMRNNGR